LLHGITVPPQAGRRDPVFEELYGGDVIHGNLRK
jgi:hypothetical protein